MYVRIVWEREHLFDLDKNVPRSYVHKGAKEEAKSLQPPGEEHIFSTLLLFSRDPKKASQARIQIRSNAATLHRSDTDLQRQI